MAQFTVRFDEFIERGRKRVLEERNAFRMNVADLGGAQASLESENRSAKLTPIRSAATAEAEHRRIRIQIIESCPHHRSRGAGDRRNA